MFTWICPKCGREVPPSYDECPDCAKQAAATEAPAPAAAPGAQAPPSAPPPQHSQPSTPPAPASPQPYPQMRPARTGLPTWAMALLFAFAIFGVVAGIYWLIGGPRSTNAHPTAAVESPAAKPGAKPNPYQKYIEISGVRFVEDAKKKTEVRFVVTNHSNADITGLSGNVTVWGRTRNSEEDAAGTFAFTADLKAYEALNLTAPFNTKLKIYELPDWQNVSTDVQITSPQ